MDNKLVFLEPAKITAEPFTTSDTIAEFAKVKHHAIQQIISKHESDLKSFGTVAFEMRACPHKTGASVEKIYHLNEQQATLLITYLKNTEPVRAFKKELVRQFFEMRKELTARYIEREKRKPIRQSMTDAIRDYIPESPHKSMKYKHFSDLAYVLAFGKNAAQLRAERGAVKDANATEFMTAAEIEAAKNMEAKIAVLIEVGMQYAEIKNMMLARQNCLH